MADEKIEREFAKQREIDRNSYTMYQNSIEQTKEYYKNKVGMEDKAEEVVSMMVRRQNDMVEDYVKHGGDPNDLTAMSEKKKKRKVSLKVPGNDDIVVPSKKTKKPLEIDSNKELSVLPDTDSDMAYDLLPIPSKGEAYANKMDRVAVASLTAEDENVIVNPNLYRDKLVLDVILRNKILSDIDESELLEGDRDAIILYLRSDGYGVEYPVTVTDDVTGKQFDTVIDLRNIHYKDFKLKGDENGWFDFVLPVSKHNIKFRFLRHKDVLALAKLEEMENKMVVKEKLDAMANTLDEYANNDDSLDKTDLIKVRDAINSIRKWGDGIENEEGIQWTNAVTNRMEMSIMEIDGNRDRQYIADFVRKMKVRDSSALRKYITENEPGLDYMLTIERPASLGGGSMTLFLQFDQFIFLNIA